MKNNIIYAFMYNACVHESSAYAMSLHYTKKGAEKAMNNHIEIKKAEFNEIFKEYLKNENCSFKFGEHEAWFIKEYNILP